MAGAIWDQSGGERIRRLTLFGALGKSPDSGPTRQLITNSARYGLTSGSYSSEWLELTNLGRQATNPDTPAAQRKRAEYAAAIEGIAPFKQLHDQMLGKRLPSQAVLRDLVVESGVPVDQAQECIDTFIVNAKYVGTLRLVSGSERIVPIDAVLEELGAVTYLVPTDSRPTGMSRTESLGLSGDSSDGWDLTCFYVTPIGAPGSEQREHSDLFLSALVEPAVGEFGLSVVRADQIGQPGMISSQIIEHLVRSRLVIADLSFHNPNVFYEVALRHAVRRPIVQITRSSDRIPFDLDQFRTIQIDTTSIYTLVPRLETLRSEIASQIRRVLAEDVDVDNPLSAFFPGFWDALPNRN